jgi:hypothetical protein
MPVVLDIPANSNHMKNLITSLILLIAFVSCRSTRQITTVVAKKDSAVVVINPAESDSAKSVRATLDKINQKHISFTTFSSKVKVEYNDDKNRRLDFNAFVRMKKDSAIWISIIAALNIEAFRVMITPDSLVIMDKLNRTIQKKTLSYLQEITKVPFDYHTLEDLIIGNPIYLDKTIVAYADQGEKLSLSTVGEAFKHILTVSKNDLSILFSKLDDLDVTRSRTANLSYAEYKMSGPWLFSEVRNISLSEKTKLDVLLDFKQVEFEKVLTFPFSIPKNYKLLN